MRRQFAEPSEIIGRGDEAGAEDPLPDAVHIHARRQRMIGLHEGFGQLQPPAAAALRDPVATGEHLQEVWRDQFAGRIHVAAKVERVADARNLALVHGVHRARVREALLDAPVVREQSGQGTARGGAIRQQLLRQQPVQHADIARLRLAIRPAPHRAAEPVAEAEAGGGGGLRRVAFVERGEVLQRVLRRTRLIVADDAGDAEPTAFVVAEVGVRETFGEAGARGKIRVQRRRGKLDGHERHAVVQALVGKGRPRRRR